MRQHLSCQEQPLIPHSGIFTPTRRNATETRKKMIRKWNPSCADWWPVGGRWRLAGLTQTRVPPPVNNSNAESRRPWQLVPLIVLRSRRTWSSSTSQGRLQGDHRSPSAVKEPVLAPADLQKFCCWTQTFRRPEGHSSATVATVITVVPSSLSVC